MKNSNQKTEASSKELFDGLSQGRILEDLFLLTLKWNTRIQQDRELELGTAVRDVMADLLNINLKSITESQWSQLTQHWKKCRGMT